MSVKTPTTEQTTAPAAARILEAATIEFAEHGYDGARIEAIARRAGVNKALLYYYFPGKAELYRRLVIEHIESAVEVLERAAPPGTPPEEAMRAMLESLMTEVWARPQIAELLFREVLNGWGHLKDEDLQTLFRVSRPIVRTVTEGIERGTFRSVEPLFVHLLCIASLNFFVISRKARVRGARTLGQAGLAPDPDAYARFVADLVVRGLAAPHPGEPA